MSEVIGWTEATLTIGGVEVGPLKDLSYESVDRFEREIGSELRRTYRAECTVTLDEAASRRWFRFAEVLAAREVAARHFPNLARRMKYRNRKGRSALRRMLAILKWERKAWPMRWVEAAR